MAFFWFLVSVVLLIIVLRRSQAPDSDNYAQGYWDGYRAFGSEVRQLLQRNTATRDELQQLIDRGGETAAVTEQVEYEEAPVEQSIAAHNALVAELAATPAVAPSVETPEDRVARSLRNLNTILYMASFLLVAAGALFLTILGFDTLKLVTIWGIIILFYGAGFVLHLTVERLRPAASAFLGTGLALVPFGGLALGQYTDLSGEVAWLITSFVGFAAYVFAALRLQSQLVSYLTLAFILSIAGSAAATADTGLVGQFVLLIIVSLLANIVAVLKPRWVPAVFSQPIEQTGQVVTPIVLVASFLAGRYMTLADYELVSTVALMHYVVAWLQSRTLLLEGAIRILASVVALTFITDLSNGNVPVIYLGVAIVAAIQLAYSLAMMDAPGRRHVERQWIEALFVVQILALLGWQQSPDAALYNTIGLLLLGATSLATALRYRYVKAALIGLIVSFILPFVVMRQLFEPALPWWSMALFFGVMVFGALWGYARLRSRSSEVRQFMTTAYIAYMILLLLAASFDGRSLVMLLAYGVLAVAVHTASHLTRQAWVQFVSALLLFVAVCHVGLQMSVAAEWLPLFVGGVTAAILWLSAFLYDQAAHYVRSAHGFLSAQVALATVVFGVSVQNDVVSRWTAAVLILAAIGSLLIRARFRTTRPALARTAFGSYVGYFLLSVIAASAVSAEWMVGILLLGVALFAVASYLERLPYIQLAGSACLVAALTLLAPLIDVSSEWTTFFIFGGAALLHYAATALHAAFRQPERQLIMASTAQLLLFISSFGAFFGGQVVVQVTTLVMLVAATISFVLRWWNRDRSPRYATLFQLSYLALYLVGLILSLQLSAAWSMAALALGAAIFWGASYAERAPWVLLVGNALLTFAVMRFWGWASFDPAWFTLGVGWILAAVFYLGYGIYVGQGDTERQRMMLWSTWFVLGGASFVSFVGNGLTVAVALMLLALAVTLGVEAYRRRSWAFGETAIYIGNLAFLRLVGALFPELNSLFYAHEWAVAITAVALMRRTNVRLRMIVAMAIVSLFSGVYALTNTGYYQLLFLAEHLALLVFGALRQKNWAIWWGIAASSLAVLYFLRNFAFLWLGFLGMLLIAIVVWRLMRMSDTKS